MNLGIPAVEDKLIKSVIINKEKNEEVTLEALNFAAGFAKIICRRADLVLWEDKIQTQVIHLGGTGKFFAVSSIDGRLYIYSPTGRRLLPVLILESSLSLIECSNEFLVYITSVGRLSVM